MNLLYLHTHDSGRCFQPYGFPAATPNIQALAARALQFNRAFSCGPTCSPSRAALLTGMAPHSNGMLGLAHRGFSLYDPSRHLAAYLGAQGFDTALCGEQHEFARPEDAPYARVFPRDKKLSKRDKSEKWDAHTCAQAEAFLREKHDKPFFLSCGLRNTHRPYPAHTANAEHIAPLPGIYNTPEAREDTANFYRSLEIADACAGRVLQALQDSGHAQDTIVLFTTDHGPAFPGYKCTLRDGGTGVALLLSYPGNPRAGQVSDRMVSHLDVFPTLCDLLHVEKPAWLQGVSLLPVIERDAPVRAYCFGEITYHAAYEPARCVRGERYKLIRRYDWHNRVVRANIDASPVKDMLLREGLLDGAQPREELFDLLADPLETRDCSREGALRNVYGELSQALTQWMRDTGDPLLTQAPRVQAPAGARVNALDAIEPDSDCWE